MSNATPPPTAESGALVVVRGVALWLFLFGLSQLLISLTFVEAYHHPPTGSDMPWMSLPWGLSERTLVSGAALVALATVTSSVLLWCRTRLGQTVSTVVLVALAGRALWVAFTAEFSLGAVVVATLNGWLASLLWRPDARAVFGERV